MNCTSATIQAKPQYAIIQPPTVASPIPEKPFCSFLHHQEKHDDQIMAYKEKLDETKQDLREARQSAKFIEAINGRQSCIIS